MIIVSARADSDTYGVEEFDVEGTEVSARALLEEELPCKHCGEPIAEYDGWVHDGTGNRWCEGITDAEASERRMKAEVYGSEMPTAAEPGKSLPGNWIGFSTNLEEESVSVQISVGDPRGCLEFTLRRWTDPETGEPSLLLHCPHPGESTPHVTMTEHHPGTYRIG